MKKLEKLKLHNLEEICVKEQQSMLGGDGATLMFFNGAQTWMVDEVCCTAASLQNFYQFNYAGMSIFDGTNGFSSGGGYSLICGSQMSQSDFEGMFRGWSGSDIPSYSDYSSTNSGGGVGVSSDNYAQLACTDMRIKYASIHYSEIVDNANAQQNIIDAAAGLQVHTSEYGDAHGAMVTLNTLMLMGLENITQLQHFNITISEIAGGDHATGSAHYSGDAVDVNWVNFTHVIDMTQAQVTEFRAAALAAGATKVLGPGDAGHSNHFHIEW